MKRHFQDALLKVSKACPAAAANANSDSIDLGVTDLTEGQVIEFEIEVPATTALVAAKDLDIHLEDSADDSSFSAIGALATRTVTGVSANGSAATKFYGYLPRDCRRYVRMNIALESGGGAITATSVTLALQPAS